MSGDTWCNLLALSVASNCWTSRTHRHVFVSRASLQVMRTISSRSISLVVSKSFAGDGPQGPVNPAAKHVNFEIVRARCACSRHVACNTVGSAPIGDGWSGQPDQSVKTSTRTSHVHICSHHLNTFVPIHVCTQFQNLCPPKARRPKYVSCQHEENNAD